MYSRSSIILRRLGTALAALVIAGLSACASDSGGPIKPHAANKAGALATAYQLNVGDKLKVTVFGEDNLSGEFEVNAVGNIPMPLIGEVRARGRTVRGFRDAVRTRLIGGYLKDPRISVEVLNYRPFFVHGEVRSGGQFRFKNGLKLRDAVAMAGGYSYRAERGHALVIREGSDAEVKVALPTDMTVMPGDNIRIPERFF